MKRFTLVLSVFGITFIILGSILAITPAQKAPHQRMNLLSKTIRTYGIVAHPEKPIQPNQNTHLNNSTQLNDVELLIVAIGIGFLIAAILYNRKSAV